ncbi:MAG: bifunctional histidinol-phosphatase/imidazoleglycerol-phosphate dehydratase HisB [Steroidobacteraceae bacterium]
MTGEQATLFLDRDGTLINEPPDKQVDSYEKFRLAHGVIPALRRLRDAGFRFVMVTNQDGLGTSAFPEESFLGPQRLLLQILESQGVAFDDVLVCPHFEHDGCACRKPGTALVDAYAGRRPVVRERSAVIGDRETDLELASRLGIRGVRYRWYDPEAWCLIADDLTGRRARRARTTRETRETRIEAAVDLDRESPIAISTGIGFFDHMLEQIARHGGFSLELSCEGDLSVDEHHTVEDCALVLGRVLHEALGDKRGVGRYGFVLPMDEAQAGVVLDLSGRAYAKFDGIFERERVGGLPTELVPHFFRSLGDALGAAIHVDVHGDNAHHMVEACFKGIGRALRQAIRIEGAELPSSKGML